MPVPKLPISNLHARRAQPPPHQNLSAAMSGWALLLMLGGLIACSQQTAKTPTAAALSEQLSLPAQAIRASKVPFAQAEQSGKAQSQSSEKPPAGWQAFGSAGLNHLLAAAHQQSPQLAASRARLEQARLRYGIARASFWPSLGLSASTGKTNSTNNVSNNGPADAQGTDTTNRANSRASLSANYDLDLFGQNRAARKAAAANWQASQWREQGDQLELNLSIATAWFTHLGLTERLNAQQQNLAIAQKILQLVDARYRAGAVSGADLSQQRANVLSQEAALLPLQSQLQQNLGALAVLIGETPQSFTLKAEPLDSQQIPSHSAQWPAQILTQRPDIQALEAELAAADADIAQTRAALFPQLSLSAAASLSSGELLSLNPATQGLSWSLSLAQTLFNGGANHKQYRLSQSLRAELLQTYRAAVLTALAQTQTALLQTSLNTEQEQQQLKLITEARLSLNLTQTRYRAGRGDLQNLLDAQRSLFTAQDALQQKRQARLLGVLDLVQAMGGWPEVAGQGD